MYIVVERASDFWRSSRSRRERRGAVGGELAVIRWNTAGCFLYGQTTMNTAGFPLWSAGRKGKDPGAGSLTFSWLLGPAPAGPWLQGPAFGVYLETIYVTLIFYFYAVYMTRLEPYIYTSLN
jgi:hypothetical protein